jgi:hypothetical protein
MTAVAFASPILPGKLEAWRRFNQETVGAWAEAHEASNNRLGITQERAWLQQTPEGNLAIIYLEVEDPERLFSGLATSSDPYDVWFRQQVLEIHGLDLAQPDDGPMPELAYEWPAA